MAKESKIRFKEANNKVGPDTGMPYQGKYNYDQVLANATGPATAGTAVPINYGAPSFKGNSQIGDNTFQSDRGYVPQSQLAGNQGFSPQYDYNSQPATNFPGYYGQAKQYNTGLNEAKQKDAASGFNGFNQRVYQILHNQPQSQQLPQYTQMPAFQQQTKDMGDGSVLMNPADPTMGHQWNVQKLQQITGLSGNDLANYMNQRFNWQAYNALLQLGAIEQSPQSRQYQDYLAQQQAAQAQQNYGGGYSGNQDYYAPEYSGYSDGYSEPQYPDTSTVGNPYYGMTADEVAARQAGNWDNSYPQSTNSAPQSQGGYAFENPSEPAMYKGLDGVWYPIGG